MPSLGQEKFTSKVIQPNAELSAWVNTVDKITEETEETEETA